MAWRHALWCLAIMGAVRLAGVVSHGRLLGMTRSNPYRGFRYPAEVIQHAVWL
jgi:hypothetical protein